MKHLAVDWGGRRIGLAASDDAGQFAFALGVRERTTFSADVSELLRIARGVAARVVVFGWPHALEHERTPERQKREAELRRVANAVQKLAGENKYQLEIAWQDERNSTRDALAGLRESGVSQKRARDDMSAGGTDARAAAVILQAFLDRNFADEESG